MARGAVNAWFESMSGFTTTGATVISHNMSPNCIPGVTEDCINSQPRGLLLWRSLTQWFGGMGIIMLGMMILSRVIGGGMALARAELTGPSLSRLRPKLKQTAIALWTLYIILTFAEFVLLFGTGSMDLFDSINHSLTTLPTGGFSTHDASIGYYDSVLVEMIVVVFMFIAGVIAQYLPIIAYGSKVFVHGEALLDASEGCIFHNAGLLVFGHTLFEEVRLALHGDHLHPWEWVDDIVDFTCTKCDQETVGNELDVLLHEDGVHSNQRHW